MIDLSTRTAAGRRGDRLRQDVVGPVRGSIDGARPVDGPGDAWLVDQGQGRGREVSRPQNATAFLLAGAELIGTRDAPGIIDALDQLRAIGIVPAYRDAAQPAEPVEQLLA
jgi:hypothetical protein